jgi:hypothetical protein
LIHVSVSFANGYSQSDHKRQRTVEDRWPLGHASLLLR